VIARIAKHRRLDTAKPPACHNYAIRPCLSGKKTGGGERKEWNGKVWSIDVITLQRIF